MLEFLNKFDVVFLLETFLSEEDENSIKDKLGSKFKLHFEHATRASNFGRPRGGLLSMINLSSRFGKSLGFVSINNFTLIELSNVDLGNGKLFFLPVYLNFNFWDRDFGNLAQCLDSTGLDRLIVIGDLNGRISNQQEFLNSEVQNANSRLFNSRNSKDSVINSNGRKLLELFDNLGLVVLNGRSLGDPEGEYTYVGANGSSVIDLAAVSVGGLHLIHNFEVLCFPGSDHLPVELTVKVGNPVSWGGEGGEVSGKGEGRPLSLLPRLRWTEADKNCFGTKISRAVKRFQFTDNDQENVNEVADMVMKSANFKPSNNRTGQLNRKQNWFDFECLKSRKSMFKLLNIFRKNSTDETRLNYREAVKNYKLLCNAKKQRYFRDMVANLDQIADAKRCWQAINSFKRSIPKMNGKIATSDWVDHFKNLLNPPLLSPPVSYAEPYVIDPFLDTIFLSSELKSVLAKVKTDKAPGFDRIPYEFYKYAPDDFLYILLTVFNRIYNKGIVPQSFKRAIIFPLHKKGDVNSVENYRGLSFIDCTGKLFASLLFNRLQTWINDRNLMTEFQAGFRKGYSTSDNIFSLSAMVHLKLAEKRGKLYCLFVDFSSAFDTIDRNALIYKLSCLGVSTKMLNIFKNYYEGTTAGVWCLDGVTRDFDTNMGLRQGCILSPLMFSLFINDLPKVLGGGCSFGGCRINSLMYADDIVILAPTATSLQHMINNLENYCEVWNLKVNLKKSKVIIFRKGGKLSQRDKFWYKGERIEIVNQYKYLGVTFTTSLSFEAHFQEKGRVAKSAINNLWANFINSNKVPLKVKVMYFDAIVRSILCYGAQVWGYIENDSVESAQKCFVKKLFKLPFNTPNYVIYMETFFEKLYFYTLLVNANYIVHVLSLPPHRLPNVLLKEIIKKRLFVVKEWLNLGRQYGVEVNFSGEDVRTGLMGVVEAMRTAWRAELEGRARTSLCHGQYLSLDLDLGGRSVFANHNDTKTISWAIKARAGLVDLNFKPWMEGKNFKCSLCNLNEDETVFHFMARCPILAAIRKHVFNEIQLDKQSFENYLNGRDWRAVKNYMNLAWKKRWDLIQEFNW